jgi:hypothetical protein
LAGEPETTRRLGDLEATILLRHDIVIADDAFVHETADPFKTFWNRTPGSLPFARLIELHQFAEPCGTQEAALAMSRGTALSRGAEPLLA